MFPEAFLSDRYSKFYESPASGSGCCAAVVYYIVFLRTSFCFLFFFQSCFITKIRRNKGIVVGIQRRFIKKDVYVCIEMTDQRAAPTFWNFTG